MNPLGIFLQTTVHVIQVPFPPLGMYFVVELFQPGVDDMQSSDVSRPGQAQQNRPFNGAPGMGLAIYADKNLHARGRQPPVTRSNWLPMTSTAPRPRIIFTMDAEMPILKAVPPAFFMSSMEMERPMPANPMAKHHV